jgi:hypothetical protein
MERFSFPVSRGAARNEKPETTNEKRSVGEGWRKGVLPLR